MSWLEPEGYDGPQPVERRLQLRSMSQPKRLELPVRYRRNPLEVTLETEVEGPSVDPVGESAGWLEDLYELCARQDTGPSIDMVISGLGWLMTSGELERCDEILRRLQVGRLLPATLLAILKETFKARGNLPSRQQLYQEAEEQLLGKMPAEKVHRLLARLR